MLKSTPSPQTYAPAPLIGAAFGALLVLSPLFLGARAYLILFSLAGLVIVVGGVIAVAFMSFAAEDVRTALDAILRMFRQPRMAHGDLEQDMANIVSWAQRIAQKKRREFGSASAQPGLDDPFVKYGLNMVLSDYAPEDVREMLETAADACYERESTPVEILQAMTSHAPAFGMVGTLVGMVALLGNLGDDVAGIAPSLAVAFLSTLYGVLSARMVYVPAAARLRQEVTDRRFRHHLIAEGMALLAGKSSPLQVQDRLNSFLRLESHDYFDYFDAPAKPREPLHLKVVGA